MPKPKGGPKHELERHVERVTRRLGDQVRRVAEKEMRHHAERLARRLAQHELEDRKERLRRKQRHHKHRREQARRGDSGSSD